MTTTAEFNRAIIERQRCYEHPDDVLRHTLDGWMVCHECGRRFRVDDGEIVERIPVGYLAGKTATIAPGLFLVLEDGSTSLVVEDTFRVPDDVVFVECRF